MEVYSESVSVKLIDSSYRMSYGRLIYAAEPVVSRPIAAAIVEMVLVGYYPEVFIRKLVGYGSYLFA